MRLSADLNYWTSMMEVGNVLRSDGNDLPVDTASGFGRLASLENNVKVIRPYKTYLKRCKRSVSPTDRNLIRSYISLSIPLNDGLLSSQLYPLLKENFHRGFLLYKIFRSGYHSLFGLDS